MSLLKERLKNTWNAFLGRDPTPTLFGGYSSSFRPDRYRTRSFSYKSIITTIQNQIAVDCSLINIKHVRLDDEEKYKETIDSQLNWVLGRSANIDQTGRAFIKDAVMSMLDEGVVALVPVKTNVNPYTHDSFKIEELRVGKILEWFPQKVRVEVYDDRIGQKKQIVVDKGIVAIVENPFYSIMNEPNSTMKRLNSVLNQLDQVNSKSSAGKLDMIIQLPYVIKSDAKRKYAEERRKDIEAQLSNSTYGVAYTDGTEKIVQLNRSLENNLWVQAKELQAQLYNQLGFSEAIFNGTADEKTMLNYQNRTIEPILSAITEEMERKWLTRTAISQKQAIRFFKDPFKLVPVAQIAEIADKFTRNEIMSSNEIRAILGMKPSNNPKADQLINSNLNQPEEGEIETEEDSMELIDDY